MNELVTIELTPKELDDLQFASELAAYKMHLSQAETDTLKSFSEKLLAIAKDRGFEFAENHVSFEDSWRDGHPLDFGDS